jgi:hypothetical protein
VRLQSADKEDEGQRHDAHRLREPGIIELDASDAIDAGEYADDEEYEECGYTEAARGFRREETKQQERREPEEDVMYRKQWSGRDKRREKRGAWNSPL